ncbi:dynein assembly factor with wdr repeat domains 1 [Nicotiana attenuata]|uniref:Dynein assembly factor with wdr repeat domains 1 n=1 Tax=Nicotiana attenuata TaxID=49451 RepID=A0A1J6JEQ1_NICAT|nr:dynein assembly factor with wdr repeat domains 1 [Nicotiana attenuata]
MTFNLLKWGVVVTDKKAGGMRVKDLRAQRISLQQKWLWRFNKEEGPLWRNIFINHNKIWFTKPLDHQTSSTCGSSYSQHMWYSEAIENSLGFFHPLFTIEIGNGEVYTVTCSPTDASLVATGGGDDTVFMWKIGQGDFAFELQGSLRYGAGYGDSVSSLAFSTDGQLLASGSLDGLIRVWDITSGSPTGTLEGPEMGIEWVRWHPRGHVVLAGSEDSSVWMWNTDSSAFMNTFLGHAGSVTCGGFTPDGKLICTGSDDATLRIWDPKSAQSIHVVRGQPYHTEGLTCLTISLDSTLALTGSKDGSAHIVNIITGKVVTSLSVHTDSIECDSFSARHKFFGKSLPTIAWICSSFEMENRMKDENKGVPLNENEFGLKRSMDNKLVIWDLQQYLPRSICEHEEGVTCLLWLGQCRYVATGCVDGQVRIWDSRSGECVKTFNGHTEAIQSLAASSNGEYLVSVSMDKTARVFEISELN